MFDPLKLSDVVRKGSVSVAFSLTQLPIPVLESIYLSLANTKMSEALAAGGIISTSRNFILHAPGSFIHLLSMQFEPTVDTEEKRLENYRKNSNRYYAALVVVTGIGCLIMPIMIFSGDILSSIGINPTLSHRVQSFFRAYAYGYFPLQWFSVNRRVFGSLCGDNSFDKNYRYVLPAIGGIDLALYASLGFGLITGSWGFPLLGNEGSGYLFAIGGWVSFLLSTAALLLRRTLRLNISQKPEYNEIKTLIASILKDHLPVSLRFYLESSSLLGLSLFTATINTNSLVTLQISNSITPFIEKISFSFITAGRPLMKESTNFRKTTFMVTSIPLLYSGLCLIPAGVAAKPLAALFLHSQTPENSLAIQKLTQTVLPIIASNELVSTLIHGQRATLQVAGQRHNSQTLRKENWIITGHTFIIQTALFLPLAFAVGLKLDYGLPGMATAYMLCMTALLLMLLPRTLHALNHPNVPPQSYITIESFKNAARNLVTYCGTTFNRCRRSPEGEESPLLEDHHRNVNNNAAQPL